MWQSNKPGTHVESIADFILARKLYNRHRAPFLLECEYLPYYAEFRWLFCRDVAVYIYGN